MHVPGLLLRFGGYFCPTAPHTGQPVLQHVIPYDAVFTGKHTVFVWARPNVSSITDVVRAE